jgi:trimeric autotransporter adhesin
MQSQFLRAAMIMAVCLTPFSIMAQQTPSTTAVVPNVINYSGVLTDLHGKPLTSIQGVTFLLYSSQQGGTPLWMETQNINPTKLGQYSATLGSTTSQGLPADLFSNGDARWLAVQIAGQPEQERVLLVAVPYALKAADAQTIGGLPPSAFVQVTPANSASVPVAAASSSAAISKVPPPGTITGVTAGTDLTGGGTSGNVTLNLNTAKVPQLATANTFTAAQTIKSTTTITGTNTSGVLQVTNTATSGKAPAIVGTTDSTAASAVKGIVNPTTGTSAGVYGVTPASGGYGLEGYASMTSGSATGVYGLSNSTSGFGVEGVDNNDIGVFGQGGIGVNGLGVTYGVVGSSSATTGGVAGVYGESVSTSGAGVIGNEVASTGNNYGVEGLAFSSTGIGVVGTSATSAGFTVGGFPAGVFGNAPNTEDGYGVVGYGAVGVFGNQTLPFGASGGLFFGYVAASGSFDAGSAGIQADGGTGDPTNLVGDGSGGLFFGGDCDAGCMYGDGIDAYEGSGLAGYFNGDVTVVYTLTAGSKDFKIDHPLDPANKYLVHSSVESSEMMNIYTGNITTDANGAATVPLPAWFETLNSDFRYQLTVIGQFAQAIVSRKIENHQFEIRTNAPNVEVSWQVTAVRHDAFAKAHPLVVEEAKDAHLRGYYLHPELYGAPPEKQLEWARHPQAMKHHQQVRQKQSAMRQGGQSSMSLVPPPPAAVTSPLVEAK